MECNEIVSIVNSWYLSFTFPTFECCHFGISEIVMWECVTHWCLKWINTFHMVHVIRVKDFRLTRFHCFSANEKQWRHGITVTCAFYTFPFSFSSSHNIHRDVLPAVSSTNKNKSGQLPNCDCERRKMGNTLNYKCQALLNHPLALAEQASHWETSSLHQYGNAVNNFSNKFS